MPESRADHLQWAKTTINKVLFDAIFFVGLREWKQREHTGKTKSDESTIRGQVLSCYDFDKKTLTYKLKDLRQLPFIADVVGNCTDTFSGSPIISVEEIIRLLDKEVADLYKKYIPQKTYRNSILKAQNDVAICILYLFQDAHFKMFDGSTGRLIMSERDNVNHRFPAGFFPLRIPENNNYAITNGKEFTGGEFEPIPISPEDLHFFHLEKARQSYFDLTGQFEIDLPKGGTAYMLSSFVDSQIQLGDYVDEETLNKYAEQMLLSNPRDFPSLLEDISIRRDEEGKLKIFRE
jgi:hypothetical protein